MQLDEVMITMTSIQVIVRCVLDRRQMKSRSLTSDRRGLLSISCNTYYIIKDTSGEKNLLERFRFKQALDERM